MLLGSKIEKTLLTALPGCQKLIEQLKDNGQNLEELNTFFGLLEAQAKEWKLYPTTWDYIFFDSTPLTDLDLLRNVGIAMGLSFLKDDADFAAVLLIVKEYLQQHRKDLQRVEVRVNPWDTQGSRNGVDYVSSKEFPRLLAELDEKIAALQPRSLLPESKPFYRFVNGIAQLVYPSNWLAGVKKGVSMVHSYAPKLSFSLKFVLSATFFPVTKAAFQNASSEVTIGPMPAMDAAPKLIVPKTEQPLSEFYTETFRDWMAMLSLQKKIPDFNRDIYKEASKIVSAMSPESLEESLARAMRQGDTASFKWLLTHEELNPNWKNERGEFLLHYAAARGMFAHVLFLLGKNAYMYSEDASGLTPFDVAIRSPKLNPEVTAPYFQMGLTFSDLPVEFNPQTIIAFLKAGYDLKRRNGQGMDIYETLLSFVGFRARNRAAIQQENIDPMFWEGTMATLNSRAVNERNELVALIQEFYLEKEEFTKNYWHKFGAFVDCTSKIIADDVSVFKDLADNKRFLFMYTEYMLDREFPLLWHLIFARGSVDIAKELYRRREEFGIDVQEIFMASAYHGKTELIRFLLEQRKIETSSLDSKTYLKLFAQFDFSWIGPAAVNEYVEVLKIFTELMPITLDQAIFGSSVAAMMVYSELTERERRNGVRTLLAAGADLNVRFIPGQIAEYVSLPIHDSTAKIAYSTPIEICVTNHLYQQTRILLDNNAIISQNALFLAFDNFDYQMIDLLLEFGAKLNENVPMLEESLIDFFVRHIKKDVDQVLLKLKEFKYTHQLIKEIKSRLKQQKKKAQKPKAEAGNSNWTWPVILGAGALGVIGARYFFSAKQPKGTALVKTLGEREKKQEEHLQRITTLFADSILRKVELERQDDNLVLIFPTEKDAEGKENDKFIFGKCKVNKIDYLREVKSKLAVKKYKILKGDSNVIAIENYFIKTMKVDSFAEFFISIVLGQHSKENPPKVEKAPEAEAPGTFSAVFTPAESSKESRRLHESASSIAESEDEKPRKSKNAAKKKVQQQKRQIKLEKLQAKQKQRRDKEEKRKAEEQAASLSLEHVVGSAAKKTLENEEDLVADDKTFAVADSDSEKESKVNANVSKKTEVMSGLSQSPVSSSGREKKKAEKDEKKGEVKSKEKNKNRKNPQEVHENNIGNQSDEDINELITTCLSGIGPCFKLSDQIKDFSLLYYLIRLVLALGELQWRSLQEAFSRKASSAEIKEANKTWQFYKVLRSALSHGGQALWMSESKIDSDTKKAVQNTGAELVKFNEVVANATKSKETKEPKEHKSLALQLRSPLEILWEAYSKYQKNTNRVIGAIEMTDKEFCHRVYAIITVIAEVAFPLTELKLNETKVAALKLLFALIGEFFHVERKESFEKLLESPESKECAELKLTPELMIMLNACRGFHKIFWELPDATVDGIHQAATLAIIINNNLKKDTSNAEDKVEVNVVPSAPVARI